MTAFLIAAVLSVAVALLLLLRPFLWRSAEKATASHRQLNAAIYRDQFAELERDRGEGELSEEDYRQARMELQRRVLEDGEEGGAAIAVPKAPKKTMVALGIVLPVAAVLLYGLLGTPAGIDLTSRHRFTSQEIERMVAGLAAKLEKDPGNLQGWAMLARSYKAMKRLDESVHAFERAGEAVDKDPQLLAEYADALVSRAGGDFAGKPMQLLGRALELDPDNQQALWLAGTAAFTRQDFGKAIVHWQRLLGQLPPESEDAQLLQNSIDEAEAKGGKAAPSQQKSRRP